MTKYRIIMEISIADTDAPPDDWMPFLIWERMEDDETIDTFKCEEIQ